MAHSHNNSNDTDITAHKAGDIYSNYLPPLEDLYEVFNPDFKNGTLKWCFRPKRHYVQELSWIKFNDTYGGQYVNNCDTHSRNTYVNSIFTCNSKSYRTTVHRIIYYMYTGIQPEVVDHINGLKFCNGITNLRSASPLENSWNTTFHNNSLPKGIYKLTNGKYEARIRDSFYKSTNRVIGIYDDEIDAFWHYCSVGVNQHGEFFNPGEPYDKKLSEWKDVLDCFCIDHSRYRNKSDAVLVSNYEDLLKGQELSHKEYLHDLSSVHSTVSVITTNDAKRRSIMHDEEWTLIPIKYIQECFRLEHYLEMPDTTPVNIQNDLSDVDIHSSGYLLVWNKRPPSHYDGSYYNDGTYVSPEEKSEKSGNRNGYVVGSKSTMYRSTTLFYDGTSYKLDTHKIIDMILEQGTKV